MSKGLAQIMKQAQMMQQKMGKLQEEAAQKTAEVSVGGGAVTVVVNGKNQVLSLVIKKEAVDPEDVAAVHARLALAATFPITSAFASVTGDVTEALHHSWSFTLSQGISVSRFPR